MGLFGEVKCGRCDRRYSAIRSRCPYCGARKKKSGKSSGSGSGGYTGNRKWQMLAGILLLVAIIVAVIVLIYMSLKPSDGGTKASAKPSSAVSASAPAASHAPTNSAAASTSPEASATPKTSSAVTSVKIDASNLPFGLDISFSVFGETHTLTAVVTPANTGLAANWVSADPKVATVSAAGLVTAVGNGTTTVYAEVGGVKSDSCIIRVSAQGTPLTPDTSGNLPKLSDTDITLYTNKEGWTSTLLTVSGTSEKPVYSSADTSVATVTEEGRITAVGKGVTSIYAAVGGNKLECTVRVPQ